LITVNRRPVAELLAELNALDEHARIDAKTSRDVGTSVLETVCAFANTPNLGGGYLLLGVAPAKDSLFPVYEAVGVEEADKVQADLASQCSSVFDTLVRPEIWVETIHGKAVIGVFIPESPAGDKPVYFQRRGLPHGAFLRVGPTDQRCT
jgi:ATP-dependent DNA helicase RecG